MKKRELCTRTILSQSPDETLEEFFKEAKKEINKIKKQYKPYIKITVKKWIDKENRSSKDFIDNPAFKPRPKENQSTN